MIQLRLNYTLKPEHPMDYLARKFCTLRLEIFTLPTFSTFHVPFSTLIHFLKLPNIHTVMLINNLLFKLMP